MIRFCVLGLGLLVALASGCTQTPATIPLDPTPVSGEAATTNRRMEALVPTPLPESQPATPHALRAIAPTPVVKAPAPSLPEPGSLRWRAGVGVPDAQDPAVYAWTMPRPGWYLNWYVAITQPNPVAAGTLPYIAWNQAFSTNPAEAEDTVLAFPQAQILYVPDEDATGMYFTPMVETSAQGISPPAEVLAVLAARLPGRTWLIGNEPDVRWQNNVTPEQYAVAYHQAYTAITGADPSAQIAIAGLSQITPLRLAYLDQVLDAYQAAFGEPMPVDVWNMHAFILQEKRDEWGADIPPGFDHVDAGTLWDIQDHGNLELVAEQVLRMRHWMRMHGQQEKPLWVTEYGILMPESYGFSPETVAAFMVGSFDLFNNLRDPELGLSRDENRLVQRWLWFSAGFDRYPTGDLFASDGTPTQLMHAYSAYLEEFGP